MTSRRFTPMRPSIVLGCDPGYERLGVAVVARLPGERGDKEQLLYSSCIRTPKELAFAERLKMIGSSFSTLIQKYKPDALALENIFLVKNQKTAMQVAEVRGVLTYLAASENVPVFHYSPPEVKVAVTGYGGSSKAHVGAMVEKLVVLQKKKGRVDDELDAIAVALTCLASTRNFPQ